MSKSLKLPLNFYQRDTVTVAKELLGKRLVHVYRGKRRSGIIVETEAYLGATDRACHTFGYRKTKRTKSMYLPGGHAYVYFVYGMHFCFNVVSRTEGEPEAVLVRALEPEENVKLGTNGPARLCKALGISKAIDRESLMGERIFIEKTARKISEVIIRPRVGVDYAKEATAWPLRFYLSDSTHVSRK
jgi:DNA-3-methyladenine glycosylase